jgi:hypothetical protein
MKAVFEWSSFQMPGLKGPTIQILNQFLNGLDPFGQNSVKKGLTIRIPNFLMVPQSGYVFEWHGFQMPGFFPK